MRSYKDDEGESRDGERIHAVVTVTVKKRILAEIARRKERDPFNIPIGKILNELGMKYLPPYPGEGEELPLPPAPRRAAPAIAKATVRQAREAAKPQPRKRSRAAA